MTKQKIYIAADHAGYELKEIITKYLSSNNNYMVHDIGTKNATQSVDYPDYAQKVVEKLQDDTDALAILVCGTGIGMSIAANRNTKIRAALCHNTEYAKLAKEHNNANVLILGARFTDSKLAIQIVEEFLAAKFQHGRHLERVKKLS